jgi:hypothetical protein
MQVPDSPPSFFRDSKSAASQLLELLRLGLLAVVFPVLIFGLLAVTKLISMPFLAFKFIGTT